MSAFYDEDEAPAEKKRSLFRRGDKARDSSATGHQRRVLFSSDQRRQEPPAPAPKESTPPRQASAFYMDDMDEILDDAPDDADEIDDILGAYRKRFRQDDDDR